MDQGFRAPRPPQRSVNHPASRPVEEPQPVAPEPKPVHRAATPHHAPKKVGVFKRLKWPLIVTAVVLVLIIGGILAWSRAQAAGVAIDSSKYQAVFFTNGQVYFGKLHAFNDEYMKLSNIYYLQTQAGGETDPENPQKTTTDQSNVQLIKLGDELHGPEDEMVISKQQVLFYENLKSDGKVAQSIAQFKKP